MFGLGFAVGAACMCAAWIVLLVTIRLGPDDDEWSPETGYRVE